MLGERIAGRGLIVAIRGATCISRVGSGVGSIDGSNSGIDRSKLASTGGVGGRFGRRRGWRIRTTACTRRSSWWCSGGDGDASLHLSVRCVTWWRREDGTLLLILTTVAGVVAFGSYVGVGWNVSHLEPACGRPKAWANGRLRRVSVRPTL